MTCHSSHVGHTCLTFVASPLAVSVGATQCNGVSSSAARGNDSYSPPFFPTKNARVASRVACCTHAPSGWGTAPRGTGRTHSPLQTVACTAERTTTGSHCPTSCGLPRPHPSLVNIRVEPLVVAPLMCLLELEQALQLVACNLHSHTPPHK